MVSPNDNKTGFYTKLDGSYVKVQYIYIKSTWMIYKKLSDRNNCQETATSYLKLINYYEQNK